MLYQNEKLNGLEHYKHSSHMASTQLMENPTTLMTALSLSVSPPQVLFPPPHNHSWTTHNIQTILYHPHPFIFVKAGFLIWVFQRYFFPLCFPRRLLGSSLLNALFNFSFHFFTPPPAYHAGAKLGAQAQALPVARRKPSTAQQCFASSQQRSLWPHTAPYPKPPRAQLMQPFLNNGALGRSPTRTKNNPPHPAKHHPFRI